METIGIRSTTTASFLLARGHRVVKTTRGDSALYFHFIKTPKLDADVADLKFGDDFISARAFCSGRDFLMTLIHEDGAFRR